MATWRRELREELGVSLTAAGVVPLADYDYLGLRRFLFAASWPTLATDFVLGEGQGYAWYGLEEALAHPEVTEQTKDDLRRLRQYLGSPGA